MKEDWDKVEKLYYDMISIFNDIMNNGLDSASFRKFKYRLAVLNESHYGDPGVEILVRLISENPSYDRYHTDVKWMLANHEGQINIGPSEDNPIMNALLDAEVTENDFVEILHEHRSAKSDEWKRYRRSLSNLKVQEIRDSEENVGQVA